jgi:hypothetical protein
MLIYIDNDFAKEYETSLLKVDVFDTSNEFEVEVILLKVLKEFPQLEVYSDATTNDKIGNRVFRYISNLNAIIRSKDQFLVEMDKSSNPFQLLAFTSKRHSWSENFEKKGGLYFTLNDYNHKIKEILSYQRSIRFSQLKNKFTWNNISFISKLPADKALIIDNYLISSEKKRRENLNPLLRILSKIKNSNFTVELLINEDKLGWKSNDWKSFDEEIRDFISDEDLNLNIKINRYSIKNGNSRYNFHDRKLFLKYLKIEVGNGFDLLPYDEKTINDKKVVIGTIFDKDTYDDFRSYFNIIG